jgi:polyhydroxybutyrate depolymerase
MVDTRGSRPARTLVAALLVMVVAGCGASTSTSSPAAISSEASATGPGSAASPIASPEPTGTPAASAGPVELREPAVTVDGDARRVKVYLPDPAPNGKLPLVVFLHPAGGSPSQAVEDTHFDQFAGREGFIAAFPPADHRTWDVVTRPGLLETQVDERFLEGMIDQLTHDLPVDPARIYVAGFSMGAVMTDRLACSLSGRIAAAAIVSGTPWAGHACTPARPVSSMVMHGTADATFPYDAAVALAARWRTVDGCPPPTSPTPVGDVASVESSDGCADGTSVEFVSVEGGPHAWFETPDATDLAWRFFVDHGRR